MITKIDVYELYQHTKKLEKMVDKACEMLESMDFEIQHPKGGYYRGKGEWKQWLSSDEEWLREEE